MRPGAATGVQHLAPVRLVYQLAQRFELSPWSMLMHVLELTGQCLPANIKVADGKNLDKAKGVGLHTAYMGDSGDGKSTSEDVVRSSPTSPTTRCCRLRRFRKRHFAQPRSKSFHLSRPRTLARSLPTSSPSCQIPAVTAKRVPPSLTATVGKSMRAGCRRFTL